MKNLTFVFMIIFSGLSYAQNITTELTNKAGSGFFVGIVIDSSPSNDKAWNIKKSRAVELLSNLNQGDKVVVLEARPGSPSICGKAVIGGPEKTGSNEIVSCVSGLNKELFFSADVARACESIYDIFESEGSDFKCLLVVITNGKLKDSQVQRIIRTSSQIKTLGGFTCLTYDPAVAKQNLINAGKKNDIDMLLESNPGFGNWLKSNRDLIEPGEPVVETKEYIFVEPDLTPISNMIDKALASLKPDPNTLALTPMPALPLEKEVNIIDMPVDKEPNNITTGTTEKLTPPVEDEVTSVELTQTEKTYPSLASIIIILLAAIIMAAAVIFALKHLRKASSVYDDDETEHQPSILKAVVGEQDIDLGEIELISELTLGNDPGCSIYIEDDQLPPQQARLFRTAKGFKLQNLDSEPVFVNGIEAKCKKKVKLDLPADIQLANGMILNLYTETESEIKDNDDGQDI